MELGRKGVFFSADALIALIIILIVLLVAYPLSNYVQPDSDVNSDVLRSLSVLKVGDASISGSYSLVLDPDKSLLEQTTELYVLSPDPTDARRFLTEALADLNTTENIGVWIGEPPNDKLIYAVNTTPYDSAREVDVAKQTITGLREGNASSGFAARAYLSPDSRTRYFYFGGYVGDGNISAEIDYVGNISSQAVIEGVIDKDFELWVNGVKMGDYQGSVTKYNSVTRPVTYNFSTSQFSEGKNLVEIRGDSLYVAGGFIKVNYRGEEGAGIGRYNFPGIQGLINLYDSFYVPYNLTSMNIHLNYNSNYTTFLTIGNVTVYNFSGGGDQNVTLTSSDLISKGVDYESMTGKTVPLRLGLENASVAGITKAIDVFSVTDVSGSMGDGDYCVAPGGISYYLCCWAAGSCNGEGKQPICEGCGGTWVPKRLPLAKEANNAFIDFILNSTGNRVGLVAYSDNAISSYGHPLSNDSASLKNTVSRWDVVGGTCICCGIIDATQKINQTSSSSTYRSMVIMSDGEANARCSSQLGNVPDMDGIGGANTYADHAIYAAQKACEQGIVIHSVGFNVGSSGRNTLEHIAQVSPCNGTYSDAGNENLTEVYEQVANSIITEYQEQTLVASDGGLYTELYPDSYIDFDFDGAGSGDSGLSVTLEKVFDDEYSGTFSVPSDAIPVITRVVSYSGPRWTNRVKVNNTLVFDLDSYGSAYTKLGDPYQIAFADSVILPNSTNMVNVSTGVAPGNYSAGSQYNKIIYTISKNSTSYSGIKPLASGCLWHIQFEDNSELQINIPDSYAGSDECYYNNETYLDPSDQIPDGLSSNDAYQLAVRSLLDQLDVNNNGKVDILLSGNDFDITLSEISGLPFDYSTEVQVRRWA